MNKNYDMKYACFSTNIFIQTFGVNCNKEPREEIIEVILNWDRNHIFVHFYVIFFSGGMTNRELFA